MGIFIYDSDHPDVYKNTEKIHEPNQVFSRQDYLTELINEQQKSNAMLRKSFAELNLRTIQQEETIINHWNQVDHQLNDLKTSNLQQKEVENMIIQFIQTISEKNNNLHAFLENEALLKKGITEKVDCLNDINKEIAKRLEKNEVAHHQLVLQMNEQLALQKEVTEKMTKQEDFQEGMLLRMDNQEVLIDKISRQLNHIRSILFERTNYLATKIDDGYKITSSYIYKLMTGSEQPLTLLLMNNKKEESQKHTD
ncbi:hypothetical protein NDK43_24890 [Neobacillus pocheonensis]|uniref:t-SNARE coiled-coil homology domain-containing protein n=1 Tax=Neobacillus pocheonensis TaxID=363869 RepID=A0ABT0WG12_9BACI|nr:hypothetical protein [Neobacillus pocheonensis]